MFKPKVTVDLRSLNRAVREYREVSKKTNVEKKLKQNADKFSRAR